MSINQIDDNFKLLKKKQADSKKENVQCKY